MGAVYAGTSGWSYPSWKPGFYPAKLASAKFLEYYASRLNTVEVNHTFRRFPTEKLLCSWAGATPANFKFAIKAHQNITHVKRLRDAGEFTKDFLGALRPLEEAQKLACVLFQLPPFLKSDVTLLEEFLAVLPRSLRVAFEFRHESWFSEPVYAALTKANSALCEAENQKLQTPEVLTASFAYLRLRKESYSESEFQTIRERVGRLVAGGDALVYFKHEETPEGALLAERLLKEAQALEQP
jgi:uncharacterized protein YecE (DUF72 family)